ncbi:MAG: HD-GYP domain-containing protein [Nitrospirales bacterium]
MPFIEVEDRTLLQLGTFIKIEGSWFSHPFPTNTFKIKSKEDLATILGLSNVTILYDPERSDSGDQESADSLSAEISDLEDVDADFGSSASEGYSESGNREPDGAGQLIPESALSEILDRREDYHEFQHHLRKVEGAYQKFLGQGNEVFKQLNGRRSSGLKSADLIVSGIFQAIQNPKTAMSMIDIMGSNGVAWGLSEHALNVCTLSLLIGRQFELDSDTLMTLGRGALFHDVGYRALPMKVKFVTGGIKVEADPELGKLHPDLGRQLMASFPGSEESVLEIIRQHHERCDGSGFPRGLSGEQLSLLPRIVMVADRYDELCNAPNPESSLNPHEALSRLYRHVVMKGDSAKYCPHVVQALVQAIGVFPPGTLVELSDGFMGIVSTINIENPARPIILLYAPWLCRNDGLLVNLAKDARLDIKRAAHPKDIPTQMLAYLSPRRMAMFAHATEPTTMAFNSRRSQLLKPALR